jgi:hypothetical protein
VPATLECAYAQLVNASVVRLRKLIGNPNLNDVRKRTDASADRAEKRPA